MDSSFGDWMIYTYTIKKHPGIDGGKVNYLDPKLMEVFIPLVHEQYDKHFKKDMGHSIQEYSLIMKAITDGKWPGPNIWQSISE